MLIKMSGTGGAIVRDEVVGKDAWSSKHIVETLCPALDLAGGAVRCAPAEGYPIEVKVTVPAAEGQTPPASVTVTRCGRNLLKGTKTLENNEEVASLTGTVSGEELLNGCHTLRTNKAWQGYKINFSAVAQRAGLRVGDIVTYSIWAKMDGTAANNIQYGFWTTPSIASISGSRPWNYTPEAAKAWRQLSYTFTVTPEILAVTSLRIECDYNDAEDYMQEQAQTLYAAPQLEVGSRATAHEPYQGEVFTLPLTNGEAEATIPALAGENTLLANVGALKVTGRADPAEAIAALQGRAEALSGKADPARTLKGTLLASAWGEDGTQTVALTGLAAGAKGILGLGDALTDAQAQAALGAQLVKTAQAAGSVTIKAFGTVPEVDIPIQVLIVG